MARMGAMIDSGVRRSTLYFVSYIYIFIYLYPRSLVARMGAMIDSGVRLAAVGPRFDCAWADLTRCDHAMGHAMLWAMPCLGPHARRSKVWAECLDRLAHGTENACSKGRRGAEWHRERRP